MNEPIALCNALIIGLTCLVSWLGFKSRAVEEKYIFEPEAILAWKEYYRLLTSGFLHAGWWHLLVNMLSLYLLGRYVEISFGAGHFLMMYFGAIVGGNVLSLYVHRHHEYRAYGASGGVCGIIFAYILLFPGASISQFIAAALHPEMARANWKIFLLVLSAAVLLLVYLWINPMFLPSSSFFGHRSNKISRSEKIPSYKREILEIDAVLEKISKNGMDSLSQEERNLLANASAKSQRRAQSKKPESGLAI